MLFTDSNYWISVYCDKEETHDRAMELGKELVSENLLLSEHAFGEVFTFIAGRYGKEPAYTACNNLLSFAKLEIVKASEDDWRSALQIGRRYGFSFTDCITLVLMNNYSAKKIVSFDSDFDKIRGVERVY